MAQNLGKEKKGGKENLIKETEENCKQSTMKSQPWQER